MDESDKDVLTRLAREATAAATPLERLRELAAHENPTVRKATARNVRLPPDLLAQLLKDEDWQVAYLGAQNKSLSDTDAAAAMAGMAESQQIERRRAAGKSLRTSPEKLAANTRRSAPPGRPRRDCLPG